MFRLFGPFRCQFGKAVKEFSGKVTSENRRIITATGYHYSGELDAQSWYDGKGRWVVLRLRAKDGSQIDFLCPGGRFVGE